MKQIKLILTLFLLVLSAYSYGHDTIYYNVKLKEVKSIVKAKYCRIFDRDTLLYQKFRERIFLTSGQLLRESYYVDSSMKILEGVKKVWYENGQLHKEINYKNGLLHGKLNVFWNNGVLKREDIFKNDSLMSGICYDKDGNQEPYSNYRVFPFFSGGMENFSRYLDSRLNYVSSFYNNFYGHVVVVFLVQRNGKISKVHLQEKSKTPLDIDALNIIKSMPAWIPGTEDGEPVECWFSVPITLDTKKQQPLKLEKRQ